MAVEIERREGFFIRKRLVRFVYGKELNVEYESRRWGVRWHLVSAPGKCIAACHQPGWKSCGFFYRREARAFLEQLR